MVSSPHYLASESGLKALRNGGSAVDAAIALNLTLSVVYSHMAGIGGDGFWLLAGGKAKGVEAIRASGPSACKATIEYYHKHGHTAAIPDRGPLAALTVPGALDGFRLAAQGLALGSRRLRRLPRRMGQPYPKQLSRIRYLSSPSQHPGFYCPPGNELVGRLRCCFMGRQYS